MRTETAKRTGTGLLIVVVMLQLVFMGMRTWNEGHLPIFVTNDNKKPCTCPFSIRIATNSIRKYKQKAQGKNINLFLFL
jgi:hypothetical protein